VLAGPQAAAIRDGALSQDALGWRGSTFYKTELELGRCLRLPAEGPCECDLYLSCAKFVTTRDYAPRLRPPEQHGNPHKSRQTAPDSDETAGVRPAAATV
jgi:hypothetical protein